MRKVYLERKTFLKYDDEHYIVYLNEETVPGYVPETMGGEQPEPAIGYAYTGDMPDGGTLIEAKDSDRDSLINGIIRSCYSQSQEDAIKTHQIQLLRNPDIEKAEEYNEEWASFDLFREFAKSTVDGWL